jgi:NADH:ubiquinone oxidoreductase subunit 6 (subunit J)
MESLINIGIILTYLMVGFAALTAIGFGIKKMMQKTNNTKKTLYTIGGLVVILIFSYLIASDEVLGSYEKYEITASTAKKVGMGLTTFYVLAIGAIGAVLYAELSKVFSK